MKKFMTTIAATAMMTGAAFAASTSNSEGEVRTDNQLDKEVLIEGDMLDMEATAASKSAEGIFTETYYEGGKTVQIQYELDENGNKNIISRETDVQD